MARARRQPDLFAARPYESDVWTERLLAAFEDASRRTGVLPLAEEALAACPGDPVILLMAATAALLDEKPDRAVVFLKPNFNSFGVSRAASTVQVIDLV